jgi:hypothetical protein
VSAAKVCNVEAKIHLKYRRPRFVKSKNKNQIANQKQRMKSMNRREKQKLANAIRQSSRSGNIATLFNAQF